jgi:membrane-associated phospholipid phosphatase
MTLTMIALLVSGVGLLLFSLLGMTWVARPNGLNILSWDAPPSRMIVWMKRPCRVLLLLFGGFLLLGWATQLSPVQAFDRIVGHHLHRRGGPSIAIALKTLVRIGDPHPLIYGMLVAVLLRHGRGRARVLRFFAYMIIGTFALELCFKILFHHVRPGLFFGLELSGYPSGTAMRAMVLAGALLAVGIPACRHTWQRAMLMSTCVGWPTVMGISVVSLGDHTPSEAVGGLLLGMAWLGICLRLLIRPMALCLKF